MQPRRALIFLFITVTIVFSGFLGTQTYHYLNNPLRVYEGIWKGKGAFYVGEKRIDSNIMMLVDDNGIRLSIHNQYQDYNYAYDVKLALKRNNHVSTDFDISHREVRGLEKFIEKTNIAIPLGGNLVRVNAWHLEQGRVFIDVKQNNDVDLSYILKRKSDS